MFCRCPLCEQARALGGKNIRTRSQALINDDLLLDLPPDNYLHPLYYGLDLSKVRTLLITHSHADHFYPHDLECLREPYSHTYTGQMAVYGNDAVERGLLDACGGLSGANLRYQFTRVEAFQPFRTGEYEVTPLPAVHTKTEKCLFYRIQQGDKVVLYAHDTGAFTEETIDHLKSQGGRFSLVSLDCTAQQHRDGGYHMGLPDAIEQKERLISAGLADENTVWVVNHKPIFLRAELLLFSFGLIIINLNERFI